MKLKTSYRSWSSLELVNKPGLYCNNCSATHRLVLCGDIKTLNLNQIKSKQYITITNLESMSIKLEEVALYPLENVDVIKIFWSKLYPHCSLRCVWLQEHAQTYANKFMCAIYWTREIIVFSLFVLLLLYISHKKFFIERFLVEDYIKEI